MPTTGSARRKNDSAPIASINIRFFRIARRERGTLVLWLVIGLLLLDRAVVIDKDKGVFVLRIGVALRASVSRAEVTCRVIFWEGGFGWRFLLSSILVRVLGNLRPEVDNVLPWSLGPVRRNQNV